MRGSWINPRQAHITLAFFEDISEKEIGSLTDGLRIALLKISLKIEFSLGKLGCFPDARRPRVLWVDIKTEDHDLNRLKELLDKEINISTNQKIEKRPFNPHLTLARFKESCSVDLHKWSQKITFGDLPPQHMKCVTFFKSELTSEGAKHSVVADILF